MDEKDALAQNDSWYGMNVVNVKCAFVLSCDDEIIRQLVYDHVREEKKSNTHCLFYMLMGLNLNPITTTKT